MEFWFSELHSPHVKFDIRVEKQLFSGESDYQRIDVFQSPEFGKFLTLNGSVIFSEQDCSPKPPPHSDAPVLSFQPAAQLLQALFQALH
jgi:hypothetical protein